MKTKNLLILAAVFWGAVSPVRADTIINTAGTSDTAAVAPQIIIIRENAPASSVAAVERQPAPEDIYYTRRPRDNNVYINGETAALIGTAALVGGAAWGYHHHRRRHRHHRYWY